MTEYQQQLLKSAKLVDGAFCCTCDKDVKVFLHSAKDKYPFLTHLHGIQLWYCSECFSSVKANKGEEKPRGVIPSKEMGKLKKQVYAYLTFLADQRGHSFHDLQSELLSRFNDTYETIEQVRNLADMKYMRNKAAKMWKKNR